MSLRVVQPSLILGLPRAAPPLHNGAEGVSMSELPGAGWFPDPSTQGQQRWWDGSGWTAHVAPIITPPPPSAVDASVSASVSPLVPEAGGSPGGFRSRPVYLSNLLRFRFWQFTLFAPLLLAVPVALVLPPLVLPIYVVCAIALGWFWLHVQMACRRCGRILAVTRLSGELEVCRHCQTPTDVALARGESGG